MSIPNRYMCTKEYQRYIHVSVWGLAWRRVCRCPGAQVGVSMNFNENNDPFNCYRQNFLIPTWPRLRISSNLGFAFHKTKRSHFPRSHHRSVGTLAWLLLCPVEHSLSEMINVFVARQLQVSTGCLSALSQCFTYTSMFSFRRVKEDDHLTRAETGCFD